MNTAALKSVLIRVSGGKGFLTLEYIDSRVKDGAAFLIAPEKPLEISRVCHDPETTQRVYDIGRKAAENTDLTGFHG